MTLDVSNSDCQIVKWRLQDFEMYHGWVKSTPTFIYALFIGALSDRFGRKPLILLPIFGALIDHVLGFINIEYIENFPIEFFYVMSFEYFLGGFPMLYLGKDLWLKMDGIALNGPDII